MLRFVVQRVLQCIPVWLGVVVAVFLMVHLVPGDPVRAITGGRPMSAETARLMRHELGLDQPLTTQLGRYVGRLARGDLGRSLVSRRSVSAEILHRLPSTLALALVGLGLGIPLGLGLGVLAALRRGRRTDRALLTGSIVFVSVPGFWLGLLFISIFSVWLGWLPIGGTQGVSSLVMPATILALGVAAPVLRLAREGMLEVLRSDYVRTARAKGLPGWRVVGKHALRNAVNPVVTYTGLAFGYLLGGAFILEQVFSRPGLGRLAVQAIFNRDFPMVQGVVLWTSSLFLLTSLAVDVSYAILDPRIRTGQETP